ncbi:MAG: efflux RND transporter periplasmic adaptor subunit, partial [Planctomycetota bacterium]
MSRDKRRILIRTAAAAFVLVLSVLIVTGAFGSSDRGEEAALFKVRRGPLIISVTESGTIKNREEVVIKNQVEGRTAILSLIPEGVHVKPGDLLVELASSRLEEQLAGQQIKVINAEAAFV